MRVTDEMICAAWNALDVALAGRLDGTEYAYGDHTPMKHALEQVFALSHASGQEAEYPECTGDPKDCPENEGHGCCKTAPTNPAEIGRKSVGGGQQAVGEVRGLSAIEGDASCGQVEFWRRVEVGDLLYTTPAQPPASAEVVDLLRRTVLAFRYVYDESCTAGVLRKDIERYLASSGRKESPIYGVTHGTDEGWGDLGPQGTHTQRQG